MDFPIHTFFMSLISARSVRGPLRAALVAGALALSACATLEQQPTSPEIASAPPYFLRAQLDDPFHTIDSAIRRVGAEERLRRAQLIDRSEEDDADLWARVIDRFEFSYCPENSGAQQWARWFGERPDYMERVMTRAHPWLYDIANELEARRLPGELALLPIVESAYDPFAYSHGRAAGAWQFLSGTARDFGLEINDFYDGRRDVFMATRAALDYLEYLSAMFDGDWNLALAAYNAGQGRVQRAIERNRARGRSTAWHDLSLPRETLAYVPKMNGLGCLFREPERFGLALPVWPNQPGFARVELDGPIDIVMLSAKAEVDLAELVALNAGLNQHLTSPTGPHHVIVPVDLEEQVLAALPQVNGADSVVWQTVSVRRGDTLSTLARRYNTSVSALRAANHLNGDMLSIGQQLRLPGSGPAAPESAFADRYQELARLHERLLPSQRFEYVVRPGDSLWVIARNHRVSVAELQRWNGLGQHSVIRPGQRLMIRAGGAAATAQAQPAPLEYTVRRGDSLWTISRRHQVSINELMRLNNLNENSVLRPGQRLVIRRRQGA